MMSPYTVVAPRARVGGFSPYAAPVRVGAYAAPRAFMAPRSNAGLFGNMDADIADYILRGNLGGFSMGTDLGLEATETAVWNMQKAGAFGGEVPDSALFTLALQNKNDRLNPFAANNLAFMTAMGGLAGNEFWNGADDTIVAPGIMGRMMELEGATGTMDTDFLAALLSSGPVLGVQDQRSDMSPFMMSLFYNSGNQYSGEDIYTQIAMTEGGFGTGYMAGALPNANRPLLIGGRYVPLP
jgi:hypothetical protein